MSYKLTIEFENLEDLYNTVSQLRGKAVATIGEPGETKVEERKPRKAKPAAEESKPTLVDDPSDTSDLLGAPKPPKKASYDDVKAATLAVVKNKGKAEAVKILAKYKASNANPHSEENPEGIKVEHYDAYVKDANAKAAEVAQAA